MDCLHACEILSEAHDGEAIEDSALAEARRHCEECAECRAFASVLARLSSAPAPRAPEDLVARLVGLSAGAAAATRESAASAPTDEPAAAPHSHARPQRPWWVPQVAGLAAAAAVLIVALTAGSIAIIGARQSADEAPLTSADTSTEMMAAPGAAESRDQPAPPAEPTAPPYVALNGDVWELADSAAPAPTAPTAAGVVISSLSDGDGASEHPASFSGSDRSVLYVAAPDGSYRAFTRVIRTLGRAEYGLVSGGVISRFGRWPSLPSRFVEPESTDGSPEFRRFGFDDLGVDVYVPPAGRTQDGFAVAPGTAGDDPAAGNPGWTWWEPLP